MPRRTRSKTHPAARQVRTDRQKDPADQDAYGLPGKLPEPTVCPACGATYRRGRWTWEAAPADARRTKCPACRRVAEDAPAGILTVSGDFAASHRQEIESLARHLEERERSEHPLKRLIAFRDAEGTLQITTTDARLARSIGVALQHAYQGTLEHGVVEPQTVFRVTWSR